ncbi:phospholipase D-like domain-containing protein [uncultured Shewanella sp.]|uniref:phospholipase D-like domain-containing protein n=1 Tax=uncultured Shewanella sp. TaxID=173975 RepID=UPI00262FCD34|nr:phospholipase D-like domain-containing protein [uncultured Shewanella sp.]
MKLIASGVNKQFLSSHLPKIGDEVDGVLAAIAYGDDTDTLLKNCLDHKYRLDIWMRYDHTVPVQPRLLTQLLRNINNNIFCQLIPDVLHSKIIWWKGYGAYIGSANLTNRAWWTNIETGIFFTEEELVANNIIPQLDDFFNELSNLEEAIPLSQSIIDEQKDILELRNKAGLEEIENRAKKTRKVPIFNGVSDYTKGSIVDKKKERFRQEWQSTITTIDNIASQINDYRPKWISADTPTYWQVDQFLHAYYYNQVRQQNNTYPFEKFYSSHEKNPNSALMDALIWWKASSEAPSNEDDTFNYSAPKIRELLAKDKLLTLFLTDIEEMCRCTHATKDHLIKMSTATLSRADTKTLSREERIPLFAKWLMAQRNKKGQDIRQILFDILYTGKPENIWERIYAASMTDDLWIPHYGINSIAEVVGWAQPETTPPRNGRTNKSLRALGYPVRVNF